MRSTLTIASSLTPHLPWWRTVSMPSAMLVRALEMVVRNIASTTPESGVAVAIRVTRGLAFARHPVQDEGVRLLADRPAISLPGTSPEMSEETSAGEARQST